MMKRILSGLLVILFVACARPATSESSSRPQASSSPSAAPGITASPTPAPMEEPKRISESGMDASNALETKCQLRSDERILTIVPKNEGCELHYAKFGKSEVAAGSNLGQSYCEKVREKIRANLKAAGFSCR